MSRAHVTAQRWLPLLVLLALRYTSPASAHSWIDCLDTDRAKIYDQSASYIFGGAGGNGFCEGYGAGYPGRGDRDIGTEYTHKMLLNEVEAGAAVCQAVGGDTYSGWRTRISVAPGTQIFYSYLPNGHIVKDKKAIGTQHGVYWTGVPGTALSTTLDMTPEHLVDGSTLDYDDGNCGETYDIDGNPSGRAGDGKPCIGHFTIPAGTAPGIYKMVWYWSFYLPDGAYVDPSLAKGYFGASYSTCFEVEVTAADGSATTAAPVTATTAPVATPAVNLVKGAVPAVKSDAPSVVTAAPVPTTAPPVATNAAPVPTPAATTRAPAVTPASTVIEPSVTPVSTALTPAATPASTALTPAATPVSAGLTPAATPASTSLTPAATPASTDLTPASTPAATTLSGSPAALVDGSSTKSSGREYSFSTVNGTASDAVGVVHAEGDAMGSSSSASAEDASGSNPSYDSVSILTEGSSAMRPDSSSALSALVIAVASLAIWFEATD